MRPQPLTNGLSTPYQRYADALPTGCVPAPPFTPQALEAAFSGAFGPLSTPSADRPEST
jgi:hypothetical protein